MRITSSMMMNKYKDSLSSNLGRLSDDSDKISSQRKFTRGSQDPIGALKALKTSHQLENVDQYQASIDETSSWLGAVESNVKIVDQIIQVANSTIIAAKNGTNSPTDGANYAISLENYSQEMLQTLNSSFKGQYIYGGADNGNVPFKMGTADDLTTGSINDTVTFTPAQVEGKLLYNIPNTNKYVPVSVINSDITNPYSVNNPDMKYTMPVDLGLGMKTDAGGNVVPGTAFEASTSALDFLVQNITYDSGTPTVPTSNNLIDEFNSAAQTLRGGDNSQLNGTFDILTSTQNSELKATVVIGSKSKMLDFLSEKMTTDNTNLTTRLSTIEDIDTTEAMLNYSVSQMVYNASLSISSQVLQHSLIDFLK